MSFLNPLFLLGLAAVAVPVIVHLVRRTRAPRVEFPSLMFVRRIPQRTIRRRRMQNWLLFALRCLAFMLLVFAFVRPYFGSGQADTNRGQRANVILFDNSFSLRYGNRFEQARQRARAVIDETRGNEPTALVTFGQGYEAQSKFTTDMGRLKAALDGVKPGSDATDYVQALRGAEGLFKETAAADKRIVLISDFQAAGRNEAEASYRLPSDIKLVTINVGEQNSPNLAITDVGLQPLIYQAKYEDKLTARVANFSDEEKARRARGISAQRPRRREARDQGGRARRDNGRIHRLQSERGRQSRRDPDRRRQFPVRQPVQFHAPSRRTDEGSGDRNGDARAQREFLFAQRADHRRKPAVQSGGQNGRLGQPGGPRRLSRNHPQRRAGQSGDGSSVDQIRRGRRRAGHRYRPAHRTGRVQSGLPKFRAREARRSGSAYRRQRPITW